MSEYSDFLDEQACDFCGHLRMDCKCDESDYNEMPWSVEVKYNGESLIIMESSCYSGKGELSKEEREAIRNAAQHLLSFVGNEEPEQEPSEDGMPF